MPAWNFHIASLYNAAMLRIVGSAAALAAASDVGSRRGLMFAVLLLGMPGMAFTTTAHAQTPGQDAAKPAAGKSSPEKAAKKTAAKADKSSTKPATNKSGNKVISLDDEFLVEGKLEKPSAFYVLRRSSTDYDWARLDAVFTPLVLESVQDPLF
jgi:hypothetical protein